MKTFITPFILLFLTQITMATPSETWSGNGEILAQSELVLRKNRKNC